MEVVEHATHTVTITLSYPEGEPANVVFDLGHAYTPLRADHKQFESLVYGYMRDITRLILSAVKAHRPHDDPHPTR